MNKKITIIFWVIVIVTVFILRIEKVISPSHNGNTLEINGNVFSVEVVSDIADMQKGLSGRDSLSDNYGMLFLYQEKQQVAFWMKDMNFDIDLLWIDGDKIIGFEKDMKAPAPGTLDRLLERYNSPAPVDKVFEIQAGKIDELNIKIGDTINFEI